MGTEVFNSEIVKRLKLVESLRFVVVVDSETADFQTLIKAAAEEPLKEQDGLTFELLSFGSFLRRHLDCPILPVQLDGSRSDESIILFSSGSTGTPKGVIQTSEQTCADWIHPLSFQRPRVEMSYLPPCWGADKLTTYRGLVNGACIGFPKRPPQSMLEIFAVFKIVNPTNIIITPVIGQAMQSEYLAAVDLHTQAESSGKRYVDSEIITAKACALAHASLNALLGNRCKVIGIGGARPQPLLLEFLRAHLDVQVVNAYGSSEVGGISSNNIVIPGVSVILIDRPDLGYTTSDKPFPRGEICVKSNSLSQIRPDKWLCSAAERDDALERYLPDGFFKTGDIGQWVPSTSLQPELEVIDRASALIKLSSGIFLSPERVEGALGNMHGLSNIMVTLNDSCKEVFAIILPSKSCSRSALQWLTLMRQHCAASDISLLSHEMPRHVLIDQVDTWSVLNGSLLPNLKLNRRVIRLRHATALSLDNPEFVLDSEPEAVTAETQVSSEAALLKNIVTTTASAMGLESHQLDISVPFGAQGADSLALVRIVEALHQLSFSMKAKQLLRLLPPRLTLAEAASSSALTLAHRMWERFGWSSLFETPPTSNLLTCTPSSAPGPLSASMTPTCQSESLSLSTPLEQLNTHSPEPQQVRKIPVSAESVIDDVKALIRGLLPGKRSQKANPDSLEDEGAVFVTGATGFFGSFFVVRLLDHNLSNFVSKVVCSVRSTDAADAKLRLLRSLCSTRAITEGQVQAAMEQGRLVAIVADVTRPQLGMSEGDVRIVSNCSLFVHAAAAVKMLDSEHGYALLKSANLDGTCNVLDLALAAQEHRSHSHLPTHFVQISTLSCSGAMIFSEDQRQLQFTTQFPKDAYSLTKCAAEMLVTRVASLPASHSLKFTIMRLPLLTWSATGVANADDWLVRLVDSCLALGVRPRCSRVLEWYRPIAYWPVDACADFIASQLSVLSSNKLKQDNEGSCLFICLVTLHVVLILCRPSKTCNQQRNPH